MASLYFKLGAVQCYSGLQVLQKIVGVIPSSWLYVHGVLHAPKIFIDNGHVLDDTGYTFTSKCDGNGVLTPRMRHDFDVEDPSVDLVGFLYGKRPLFVELMQAGSYGRDRVAFMRAKVVASTYLSMGYRGKLDFAKDACGVAQESSVSCQLRADPEDSSRTRPLRPWYLKIEWIERLGGERKQVDPIVRQCTTLGLPELNPGILKAGAT